MTDFTTLPDNLPVPRDDGAADHLTGLPMPELSVQTSDRQSLDLAATGPGRTIIYLYPLTGRPGVDLPEGWDAIPGARPRRATSVTTSRTCRRRASPKSGDCPARTPTTRLRLLSGCACRSRCC